MIFLSLFKISIRWHTYNNAITIIINRLNYSFSIGILSTLLRESFIKKVFIYIS
jgi:hypothetical protein